MRERLIFTLGLILTLLSCSDKNELRSRLEKQLPTNASAKVKSVYYRYVDDCVDMYSYFKDVKIKTPQEDDKSKQDFRKEFPNSYMLKSAVDVCKENNVTDSTEIKTIDSLLQNMMKEYFAYIQR